MDNNPYFHLIFKKRNNELVLKILLKIPILDIYHKLRKISYYWISYRKINKDQIN